MSAILAERASKLLHTWYSSTAAVPGKLQAKYIRRRHFNPLTDGILPFIYLDGRQTTRFWCRTLGLTPLTDARFPLTDRLLTSLLQDPSVWLSFLFLSSFYFIYVSCSVLLVLIFMYSVLFFVPGIYQGRLSPHLLIFFTQY